MSSYSLDEVARSQCVQVLDHVLEGSEIAIAVNLSGYSTTRRIGAESRAGVLAHRPAPERSDRSELDAEAHAPELGPIGAVVAVQRDGR